MATGDAKLKKTYFHAAETRMLEAAMDIIDYAKKLHNAMDDLQRETLCENFESQYGIKLPEVVIEV